MPAAIGQGREDSIEEAKASSLFGFAGLLGAVEQHAAQYVAAQCLHHACSFAKKSGVGGGSGLRTLTPRR
jgi:hypothetical protein